MRLMRMAALGATLLGLGSLGGQARAAFPDHPIEFLCVTSAGSGAANWCLMMAKLVGKQLDTPIEVVFKPGGAGNEAATYFDNKPADGYTWLQRNTSFGGYMSLPTFRPDPKDFDVALEVEKFIYLIAVKASSPYKTFDDLLKAMKSGTSVTFGANKPGSAHHLQLEQLFSAADVPWTYVPYDGAGGAMRDVLGGHLDAAIGPPSIWQSHVDAGEARYLFLINDGPTGKPQLDKVPSLKNYKFNYDPVYQVQGLFLKHGTPDAIRKTIDDAWKKATESKEYQDYLASDPGVVPAFSDDMDANNKRFEETRKIMAKVLKDSGQL